MAAFDGIKPLIMESSSGTPDSAFRSPSPALKAVDGTVRIGGIVGQRINTCIDHRVLAQPVEPLVAPFRDRSDGPDGFRGEFWGKWFTSLVLAEACRKDPAIRAKLEEALQALLATQSGDGCISTYPYPEQHGMWDAWSRKYVLLGLLHHHQLTGEAVSLEAGCRMLDHFMTQAGPGKVRLADCGHWAWQGLPPSSILEPVALLYRLTGNPAYLDYAEWIVASWNEPSQFLASGLRLVEAALEGKPAREVGNPKAYEQMSCFEGLCELYLATGKTEYREAALSLARSIRETELTLVGSGSNHEMWCQTARHQTETLEQPQETCATVTWMKYCHRLLQLTGSPEWADELETSLYNALASAMQPDGTWWAYYNPLNGQRCPSFKQYGDVGLSCCVASGPRGLLLTPQWAVMESLDGGITVNLYSPGTAECRLPDGSRVRLSLETDYPVGGQVRLRIGCERPTAFTLRLRIPAWSRSTRVFVGDSVIEPHPGSYAEIELEWRDGDAVVLELDLRTRAVPAPSGAPQFALVRGPLVLALDRRLVEPDDRSLLLVTDSEGYVEACPVPSPDPRILFTCEVPFLYHKVHIEKIPQGLLMCDYASAGNTWSAESLFRTWLPQPLFMRQAFIEGTDRLQNPKGWGHG